MLWKIWIENFPDLSNSGESICFPQLRSFLWVAEINVAFEKSERFFLGIIAPKTKWLLFENSLSVIWRFIPSIPLKYINPCVLAWFIEVITSLQTCYSFIYPSACAVKNFVQDTIIKVYMESIFEVFSIGCSGVWGKTTYSTRYGIAFLLSTSGY